MRMVRSSATQHISRETVYGRISPRASHMLASSRSQFFITQSTTSTTSCQASSLMPGPYLSNRYTESMSSP
jgi:hypothetical protein